MFVICSLLIMLITDLTSVPARGPEPNKVSVRQGAVKHRKKEIPPHFYADGLNKSELNCKY